MKDRVSIKRFLAFLLCAAMLVMYMPSPRLAFADVTSGDGAPVAEEPAQTPAPAPAPAVEPQADPTPAPADAEPSGGSDGGEELDAEVPAEGKEKPSGEVSDDSEGENAEEQGDTLDGEAVDGEIVDGEVVEDPEEEEYPAFKESKTVDGVTITLEAEEGVLPKGVSFKAHRVNSSEVLTAVGEKLEAEGKELVDAVAFDVTPVDKDGNEIHQPKGSVKVTFSGTGLDNGNVDVFRVSDDAGSVTEMGTKIANTNVQQFDTNHFTIFVSSASSEIDEAHNGVNNGAETEKHYILEYGESITLKTDLPRYWAEDWDVTEGASFIERFDKTQRVVKNQNTTSADGQVTVVHRYRNIGQFYWDTEYFYITAKPQKVTVTFKLQDVDDSTFKPYGEEVKVYKGSKLEDVPAPDATKEVGGVTYTFFGWCSDEGCQTDAVFEGIENDLTVYGKYTTKATIVYKKNTTDKATVPEKREVGIGNKITIGGASRSGHALTKWTTNADGSGTAYIPGDVVTVEGDMTLYANWDESKIHIHYYRFSDDSDAWKSQDAPKNSQTTLLKDAPQGFYSLGIYYMFRGWSTSERATTPECYPGETFYTEDENVNLYAVWGRASINNLQSLTAKSDEVTYNGNEQNVSGVEGGTPWEKDANYVKVGDTAIFGYDIYAYVGDIKASGKNAGHYSTPLSAPLYYYFFNFLTWEWEMGRMDGAPYMQITGGTLWIKQVELKVSTDSAEKPYDGTALTKGGKVTFTVGEEEKEAEITPEWCAVTLVNGDTLNMKTTGSQTEVGQSDNTYDADWGIPDDYEGSESTAYRYNYKFADEADIGTLKVYYKVVFDKNTSDDVTGMPTEGAAYKDVETGAITAAIPDNKPSREHNDFLGWANDASAAAQYQPGESITVTDAMIKDNVVTLYAVWEKQKYEVKFVDYDDTPIGEAKKYDYGTAKEEIEVPADPTREATAQYTYTFTGWTPEIADVTDNAEYKATYSKALRQYTVTFKNDDGTVLSEKEYDYGTAASAIVKPANPTKAADSQYTYTFDKWTPEIAEVTKDATYTATFTRTPIPAPTPTPTPEGTTDDDDDNAGNAGGGRAAAAVAPAAPADGADDIVDEPTPTTEPPATTIDDEPTPTSLTWAVGNLVMAIMTALGAVIALFRKKEDEDDEDDSADKKMLAAKIAGALAGVAAPITFFLTENMADVAVAFDKWTPLMAGILAVQVVSAVLNKTASKAADAAEEAAE